MNKWPLFCLVLGVVSCTPTTTSNTPSTVVSKSSSSQLDFLDLFVLDENIIQLLKGVGLDKGFIGFPIAIGDVPVKLLSALRKTGDLAYCEYFTSYSNINTTLTSKEFFSAFQTQMTLRKIGVFSLYGEDLSLNKNSKVIELGQPFVIFSSAIGRNLSLYRKNRYLVGTTDEKLSYPNFTVCIR